MVRGPTTSRLPSAGVAALAAVLAGESAAAVRGPYTLEPVRALAAADTAIAAIVTTPAGPQVLLLGRDRPEDPVAEVGRWPELTRGRTSRDGDRLRKRRLQSDVDDVLWEYGLEHSERDTWLTEELLEQEGLDDGDRKGTPPQKTTPPIPRALAATETELWLATSRGVWRLEGCGQAARWRPTGLTDRDVSQLALARDDAGRVVVTAITDGTRWRSSDQGATWQPAESDRPFGEQRGDGRAKTSGGGKHLRAPAARQPTADVTAVAIAGDDVWIGSRHGLFAAARDDDLSAWSAASLLRAAGADLEESDDGITRGVSARPAWTRYIPRIEIELGGGLRGARHELRALLIVTLPLQRAFR